MGKMRLFFLGLIVSLFFFSGCTTSPTTTVLGNWVKRAEYSGNPRSEAIAFTIGDSVAYVGLGDYQWPQQQDANIDTVMYNDLWEYHVSTNTAGQGYWTQQAAFPGSKRYWSTAFSIGNKGYVGLGYDAVTYYNDFWEYDPQSNSWSQKANFKGSGRYEAVGFSIGNYGYMGTGIDITTAQNDFYRYNPGSDNWDVIYGYGGVKRRSASAFVVDGKAYVVGGLDNNGQLCPDLWMYDPNSGWSQKREIYNISTLSYDDNYTTIERYSAVAFGINHKGYIALGAYGTMRSNTWEYDPIADLWTEKTPFGQQENGVPGGPLRINAVAFTLGNRAFITTGSTSLNGQRLDDCWEFRPNDTYNANAN